MKKFLSFISPLFFLATAFSQKANQPFYQYLNSDTVLVSASSKYIPNTFLRGVFMGANYRTEWNLPVKLPVFRLSKTSFKIKKLGGGMQTKSLQLEDEAGNIWALRTVDKDVAAAMPPAVQNTLGQRASQDIISASFPYGAPVVGALAKAAGIKAAEPKIFFVAPDAAFGSYDTVFKNTVCLLEMRDAGWEETVSSRTLLERLRKESGHLINQKYLLKCRLLDMLLADWDRHEDNWRWAVKDSAGLKFYTAIPRDRDQAFFKNQGLVPKIAQVTVMPFINGFKKKPDGLIELSYKAWMFDEVFLNEPDKNDWEECIKAFQRSIPDKVIEDAVQLLPGEIYAMDKASFVSKLKTRRDGLMENVLKYYAFLAKRVVIDGSDKKETFRINGDKTSISVTVFNDEGAKLYERQFHYPETINVVLNGFGGEDTFVNNLPGNCKIRLAIDKEEGKFTYQLPKKPD